MQFLRRWFGKPKRKLKRKKYAWRFIRWRKHYPRPKSSYATTWR